MKQKDFVSMIHKDLKSQGLVSNVIDTQDIVKTLFDNIVSVVATGREFVIPSGFKVYSQFKEVYSPKDQKKVERHVIMFKPSRELKHRMNE